MTWSDDVSQYFKSGEDFGSFFTFAAGEGVMVVPAMNHVIAYAPAPPIASAHERGGSEKEKLGAPRTNRAALAAPPSQRVTETTTTFGRAAGGPTAPLASSRTHRLRPWILPPKPLAIGRRRTAARDAFAREAPDD